MAGLGSTGDMGPMGASIPASYIVWGLPFVQGSLLIVE